MVMNVTRQQEIALKLVEAMLIKKGITNITDFRREAGNIAKEIGIELPELIKFYEAMLPKVIGRMLGYGTVSLTCSNPVSPEG
jgi:hypothetical protein